MQQSHPSTDPWTTVVMVAAFVVAADAVGDVNSTVNSTESTDDVATPLVRFSAWYQGVHGYVSIAVCLFGIASNLMNIVILTRKNMISPTNHLLTALATADVMTMMSYLPYAAYFNCFAVPESSYDHHKVHYQSVFYFISFYQ